MFDHFMGLALKGLTRKQAPQSTILCMQSEFIFKLSSHTSIAAQEIISVKYF